MLFLLGGEEFSPPVETKLGTEILGCADVDIFGVDNTGVGRVALLLDSVDEELFETVDNIFVDDEGVDACTKSLREVEDEITDVFPVAFFETELGVNVVLLA